MFNKKAKQVKAIPTGRQGFSIGEVMISVFILAIIATAIIDMYVTGLNEITDGRDNVIASLLAQEGVELVRNNRDNNWASGGTGDSFVGIDADNNCSLDYNDDTCGNDLFLTYNGSFYVQSGSATKFGRRIEIVGTGDNRVITSLVTWDGSTPPGASNVANCTVINKCVFSQATLTEWGEQ